MIERGTERPSGIIPAYAGNTGHAIHDVRPCGDHPRICGEHVPTQKAMDLGLGSSPHMRGTPGPHGWARALVGIIPAYAGNTSPVLRRCFWPRDHPRICGEHYMRSSSASSVGGSSPHMRGTLIRPLPDLILFGIIPAYAGNTSRTRNVTRSDGDHPRICGEHVGAFVHDVRRGGSSPHMRGTPGPCPPLPYARWIIPAYAGNTFDCGLTLSSDEDHPRICGEHRERLLHVTAGQGSSPHMRGTHCPNRKRMR